MMRRTLPCALALSMALASATPTPARAELKSIQTARLTAQIHVDAPVASVWLFVTRGSNFASWMPLWKQPRNARINLVKVGDWLDYVDEWNNKGRSVVTYLVRNREVRLANDPTDGSFMCQIKLSMDKDSTGTLVRMVEQYTDESAAADFSATAQKTQAGMDQALRALKTQVERRRTPAKR